MGIEQAEDLACNRLAAFYAPPLLNAISAVSAGTQVMLYKTIYTAVSPCLEDAGQARAGRWKALESIMHPQLWSNVRKRKAHSLRFGALHRQGGIQNPVILSRQPMIQVGSHHTISEQTISLQRSNSAEHFCNVAPEMKAWPSFAGVVILLTIV